MRPDIDLPLGSGVLVTVESLLLGTSDGLLTYRRAEQDLGDDETPDAAARRLAGFAAGGPVEGRMLHSTSWRFAPGRIVLTYVALFDPDPRGAAIVRPLDEPARGTGPLEPSPPQIAEHDVVMHACRHLAFLRQTDPVVATASRANPVLWALLRAYEPDVAGQRTAS